MHFRRLIAKSIHNACFHAADLAKLIMRAAGGGTPGRTVSDDDGDNRRPKVRRSERLSPVSIDHTFGAQVQILQRISVLPMCTNLLHYVYCEMVCRNLWNARFHRGRGGAGAGGFVGDAEPVRALATRHLQHPSTDGWNVVAGASAMALEWAISATDLARHPTDEEYELSKDTRIRLAVCLCVAWKFERSCTSNLPRRFHAPEPGLLSPHTHELAYVGYGFLTPGEQDQFGPWEDNNAKKIRALYHAMVALEIDLLASVNVYGLMVRNVQVRSEERIATLLDAHFVDAHAAMAMRSVVPLFIMASQDGKCAPPSAGALVCAAMLCMSVPTTVRAPVLHCHETVRDQFTTNERRGACTLIEMVMDLKDVARDTVSCTCYCNNEWVHYPFVCKEALRMALLMVNAV